MLVDSHCHLDFNDFEDDFEDILLRAKENGVTAMLNAGNNVNELDNQLALSEKYPFIYTAVGVHPDNASEYENITAEDLIAKTKHKKVVAIGASAAWTIIMIIVREMYKLKYLRNILKPRKKQVCR